MASIDILESVTAQQFIRQLPDRNPRASMSPTDALSRFARVVRGKRQRVVADICHGAICRASQLEQRV